MQSLFLQRCAVVQTVIKSWTSDSYCRVVFSTKQVSTVKNYVMKAYANGDIYREKAVTFELANNSLSLWLKIQNENLNVIQNIKH